MDIVNYEGSAFVPFAAYAEYDTVKIMVFDSITDMVPLCEAYETEIPESINMFMLN